MYACLLHHLLGKQQPVIHLTNPSAEKAIEFQGDGDTSYDQRTRTIPKESSGTGDLRKD